MGRDFLHLRRRVQSGPDSSVGIATELRAGQSGIESRWGRDFPPVQTGPGAHPASCTMGTGSLPEVKSGRGVSLNPHLLLVPWSRKGRAIPLLPYGSYGLYRASVPVQECTLPFLYFSGRERLYGELRSPSTVQRTSLFT